VPARLSGVAQWSRYLELWYGPYAVVGAVVGGGIPILLPLSVIAGSSPRHVGLAIAAFNAGTIMAPVCGMVADKYRLHGALFVAGTAVTGVGAAMLAVVSGAGARSALAFAAGCGASAVLTVAYLLVVEVHPQDEWSPRIGAAQLLYEIGQIIGLLFAGAMIGIGPRPGLLIAGSLAVAAAIPAWLTVQTQVVRMSPASRPECAPTGRQRMRRLGHMLPRIEHATAGVHHLRDFPSLRLLGRAVASPLAAFLAIWTVAYTGSQVCYSMYPLVMQQVFNIDPGRSSFAYALAVVPSLLLFTPAGRWTNRWGPGRMIQTGFEIRAASLLAIAAFGYLAVPRRELWALAAFAALVLTWPMLGVSAPAIVATYSPVKEGEGMGLYNAASAVGTVCGAILGGIAAELWGYRSVAAVGAVCVVVALVSTAADRNWGRPLQAPQLAPPGEHGTHPSRL
jgi:MFS family permease